MKRWNTPGRGVAIGLAAVLAMVLAFGADDIPTQAAADAPRILIDASRDGGVWWFPQSEQFDPDALHQGKDLADHLRGRGYTVDELPRPYVIDPALLASYDLVVRANEYNPCCGGTTYQASEIAAYQQYVAEGGRLLLLADYKAPGEADALGGVFGLVLEGHSQGENEVTRFAPHPITAGVSSIPYWEGSGVREDSLPGSSEIIGWLSDETWLDMNANQILDAGESTGSAALGVMSFGSGRIVFMGEMNGIESVPQPFTDDLFGWLLECAPRGQKNSTIVNVAIRLGSEEGQRRYKARYDLNHDGRIDADDMRIALQIPVCQYRERGPVPTPLPPTWTPTPSLSPTPEP